MREWACCYEVLPPGSMAEGYFYVVVPGRSKHVATAKVKRIALDRHGDEEIRIRFCHLIKDYERTAPLARRVARERKWA